MKIIGCGIPSWNLIYFPLFPITEAVKDYFLTNLMKENILWLPLWLVFVGFLSEVIISLPYLYIIIHRLITSKPSSIQKYIIVIPQKSFEVIQKTDQYDNLYSIIYLIVISLIKTTVALTYAFIYRQYGSLSYPGRDPDNTISTLIFSLSPITFFSLNVINYFILNLPLFNHQKVAMVIIVIGMIILISPNMQYEREPQMTIPLSILMYIFNSIQDVSEKWLMNKKYYTVFSLLFYEGSIGVICCIIVGYIIEAVPGSEEVSNMIFGSSSVMWKEIRKCFRSSYEIFNLIGKLVFTAISSMSLMQIKYHYTPIHCGIANFLAGFFIWIVLITADMTILDHAGIIVFGHLCGLIGILIYTELVILYFCGLEINTTKEINNRSKDEFNEDINDQCVVEELANLELTESMHN